MAAELQKLLSLSVLLRCAVADMALADVLCCSVLCCSMNYVVADKRLPIKL
jgi:hypothetical protein